LSWRCVPAGRPHKLVRATCQVPLLFKLDPGVSTADAITALHPKQHAQATLGHTEPLADLSVETASRWHAHRSSPRLSFLVYVRLGWENGLEAKVFGQKIWPFDLIFNDGFEFLARVLPV
jgi:hypothetical protein